MLDNEDYENMEVFNKVTIRKIQVELNRIYKADKKFRMSDEHAARREKIRKAKLFTVAAKRIQNSFRKYLLRKEIFLRIEIRRVAAGEAKRRKDIESMGVWWVNRNDIPSKHFRGDRLTLSELPGTNIVAESDIPILPPIKSFGRHREHLTCKGWGRFMPEGGIGTKLKWTGVGMKEVAFISDVFHPTRHYTSKLAASGYDERRQLMFKGLAKDLYNPAINRQDLLRDHKKSQDNDILL